MTSIIPFSGFIVDVLAIAAFFKTFGSGYMWLIVVAWILSSTAKHGLYQSTNEGGDPHKVSGAELMVPSLLQDVECVIALYGLLAL